MKLSTKLALFISLSKLAIALFFVLALPYLIDKIAFNTTNELLKHQKRTVLKEVEKNGVDYYLQGNASMGSYTVLKEEFIAIEPVDTATLELDTLTTDKRIVEQDTLTYRVLSHTFRQGNHKYLLEVGKTITSISQYNRPLQRLALIMLLSLILITLIIDLIYTHFTLKPLGLIIRTKLLNQKFPFAKDQQAVKTSTSDFQYLDSSLMALMEQINGEVVTCSEIDT